MTVFVANWEFESTVNCMQDDRGDGIDLEFLSTPWVGSVSTEFSDAWIEHIKATAIEESGYMNEADEFKPEFTWERRNVPNCPTVHFLAMDKDLSGGGSNSPMIMVVVKLVVLDEWKDDQRISKLL